MVEAASAEESSSAASEEGAPEGADAEAPKMPEVPVPPSFDLPWSLEQLEGELFRLVIATFPEDQQAAYPRWREDYQDALNRWAL